MANYIVSIEESVVASDVATARATFIVSIVDSAVAVDVPGASNSLLDLAETSAATDAVSVSPLSRYATIVEAIQALDHWGAVSSASPTVFYPVYENINPVFMDLYVNDVLIIGGVLMLDRVLAVRDDYLGFIGDLAIIDTRSNEDPVGVPLRLPPPDLRNAAQRALPIILGGKMPPEGSPNKIPGLGDRWLLTYWPVRPAAITPSSSYQIVPLTDAPSQRVSITLGGQSCRIDVYTKSLNVPIWEPGGIIT